MRVCICRSECMYNHLAVITSYIWQSCIFWTCNSEMKIGGKKKKGIQVHVMLTMMVKKEHGKQNQAK